MSIKFGKRRTKGFQHYFNLLQRQLNFSLGIVGFSPRSLTYNLFSDTFFDCENL